MRLVSPELEAELHGSQTAKVELAAYTYAPNGWSDYDIIWNYPKLELEVSLRWLAGYENDTPRVVVKK